MFGLFSKKSVECPIHPDTRLWMENAFVWLAAQFGEDNIQTKPMLLPTPGDFPIRYDGSKDSLIKTAAIVAKQMEIDLDEVHLDIYDQSIQEFTGDFGHRIWTEVDKNSKGFSAGVFFDKDENGKYDVLIEKKNLGDPINMVATLAHEFAHIKLLGEKRLGVNDESLTDLVAVVFGLGIFNANSAYRDWKSFDGYGHNSIGYLKQREWGYALALYAFYRKEESSAWTKFLTLNIRSDFKKSMQFIKANENWIFKEAYNNANE